MLELSKENRCNPRGQTWINIEYTESYKMGIVIPTAQISLREDELKAEAVHELYNI